MSGPNFPSSKLQRDSLSISKCNWYDFYAINPLNQTPQASSYHYINLNNVVHTLAHAC